MKEESIKQWIKDNKLKRKQIDIEKIRSLLKASENNVEIVKKIELNDKSSTLIFRELYESIRQLGEACWLLIGYESSTHEISLESLKELEIKNKIKLNHLDRYRKIRHDANYQGFSITLEQSKEMLEFWDICAEDIIKYIKIELEKFKNIKP